MLLWFTDAVDRPLIVSQRFGCSGAGGLAGGKRSGETVEVDHLSTVADVNSPLRE
jgi:hypothetical protein